MRWATAVALVGAFADQRALIEAAIIRAIAEVYAGIATASDSEGARLGQG